ncbi:MAG TPA: tripartite tricarboxylate transporter substrate-binding protein [Casimicrobiaceae bacterium]|nr:tripartite tricarboxylate transporter substrate-binding protein [Casimicrobiaceae bacterium]
MSNTRKMRKVAAVVMGAVSLSLIATGAAADWKPSQPIEFIVTAGPGGGTDNFARTIQAIVTKYKLIDQPIVVVNKGGGSGAEGFQYGKSPADDAYKVTFATNNEYLLPLIAKLSWKGEDFTPVAAMAVDEFILWVNGKSEFKTAKAYIDAAKAKPGTFKMGGSQSKDTDQTLTSEITAATGATFLYVPFKSGGEAAVQLAGGHIDSNTDNPSESIGQWKGGLVMPLCVFSAKRLAPGPKVTDTMGWSDIPTCAESGIPIEQYQQPRTVWVPKGAPADAVAYYAGVLAKVRETPEWKTYIERSAQTDRFLTGAEFKRFAVTDEQKARKVFEQEGWLVR